MEGSLISQWIDTIGFDGDNARRHYQVLVRIRLGSFGGKICAASSPVSLAVLLARNASWMI